MDQNLDEICIGHLGEHIELPDSEAFYHLPKCKTCKIDEYNHMCPSYYPVYVGCYEVKDDSHVK